MIDRRELPAMVAINYFAVSVISIPVLSMVVPHAVVVGIVAFLASLPILAVGLAWTRWNYHPGQITHDRYECVKCDRLRRREEAK